MRHLMLDLETLGTTPGCVVLSIGACCGFVLAQHMTRSTTLVLKH